MTDMHPDAEELQREWLAAADEARAVKVLIAAFGCGSVLLIGAGITIGFLIYFRVL